MRFATMARVKPHAALCCLLSPVLVTCTRLFSTLAETLSPSASVSSPFGPFTLKFEPSTPAVMPFGTGTGFLPISDIPRSSEHRAENFAAHVLLASIVVGHHALRRRKNRDTEAVVHARQRLDGRVDAAPGLRHALDLPDHRLAVEVFELDFELRAAVLVFGR